MSALPPDEQIDALAQQAAEWPPDERRVFLRNACPTAEIRDAVRERIRERYEETAPPSESDDANDDAEPNDEETIPATHVPTLSDEEPIPPDDPSDHGASDSDRSAPAASDDALDEEMMQAETVRGEGADVTETQDADASGTASSPFVASPFGAPPKRIGPWRLVRLIGRGGMGTVHLAERDDGQFQQQAALKLIRHDLGPSSQQRFLTERQILAQLQHPNIAHLLDGGVTHDGRPYFVMEYVDGIPLDTYCRINELDLQARLHLFQQVCEAVQFAHRNLIVHRDLKPSNILVTEPGSDTATGTSTGSGPQVKLLDFGIAKALEGAEAGAAGLTRTGEGGPMTPSYAAPEQMEGNPVTTATDVYALGLVLCELLTGALPYDVRDRSLAEAAQVIVHDNPKRLSQLGPEDGDGSSIGLPDLSADALQRRLRGDLDVIVQKTLRKEPGRRYASAAELGQDIGRYLDGLPVEARPATTGYRIRRFVARNRATVLGAAGALVALVLGFGVAVWQAQVAATERDRAEAARDQAQAAAAESQQAIAYLTDLFEGATPEEAQGDTLTVYDLVDRGRDRLDALSEQPELQARMAGVVGRVYKKLSEYDAADSLLQRAIAVQQPLAGRDNQKRLGILLHELAGLHWEQERLDTADSLVAESIRTLRAAGATSTEAFTDAIGLKANIALSRRQLQEADSLLQRAAQGIASMIAEIDTASDVRAGWMRDLAILQANRGGVQYRREQYAEAESTYRDALQTFQRLHDATHPNIIQTHSAIGLVLREQKQFDEAASFLETAVARGRDVFGPMHARMAMFYVNLGLVREEQEQYAVADSLFRLAMQIDRNTLGPDHPYIADDWNLLGNLYLSWERWQQAYDAFAEEISRREPLGPSPGLAIALYKQGRALVELERYNAAEARLLDARAVNNNVEAPDSLLAKDIRSQLETVYQAQGRMPDSL